ncbi:hypothetical protein [Janthinobacterium sp. BJB426]|uniref:hypothetical protein n=1 Tax=Janthinobacterium sp. BJB426 TaxID=2048010 RepID=UPI001305357F|nr:hypothetical protein [Janthinobacterium sp. BJB426]
MTIFLVLMWREIKEGNLTCGHSLASRRNRRVPRRIRREAGIDMAVYEIRAGA